MVSYFSHRREVERWERCVLKWRRRSTRRWVQVQWLGAIFIEQTRKFVDVLSLVAPADSRLYDYCMAIALASVDPEL